MNREIIADSYQDILLEIENGDYKKLSVLAQEVNMTENELINSFIEYGLNHCAID